jgi:hypothetical protein
VDSSKRRNPKGLRCCIHGGCENESGPLIRGHGDSRRERMMPRKVCVCVEERKRAMSRHHTLLWSRLSRRHSTLAPAPAPAPAFYYIIHERPRGPLSHGATPQWDHIACPCTGTSQGHRGRVKYMVRLIETLHIRFVFLGKTCGVRRIPLGYPPISLEICLYFPSAHMLCMLNRRRNVISTSHQGKTHPILQLINFGSVQ